MASRIDPQSFLVGGTTAYLVDLYRQFLQDPESLAPDWQHYFNNLSPQERAELKSDGPPQWSKKRLGTLSQSSSNISSEDIEQATADTLGASQLIREYRVRGHLHAKLDPLGLEQRAKYSQLDPAAYGFKDTDWQRPIHLHGQLGLTRPNLQQLVDRLEAIYCGTIGAEFMHIQDPQQRQWIQEHLENRPLQSPPTAQEREQILRNLIAADSFERFLHVKYPGAKRFGLEGGESLIPALDALVTAARGAGVEKVVLGMAHRGRLSVLANILHKPLIQIFTHFEGGMLSQSYGSGDVKYHLGYSQDRVIEGEKLRLSLTPNPSHLEAVNPVVLGKVRAEQALANDDNRCRIMAVLMHGDAAFAGQGLVAETLELSDLKGYRTGGTVHIIVNNQIGFTTSPPHSRSSPYSSDIAKAIQAPILHVNADDPEAVTWATRLAFAYQRTFGQDVVLDLICYRRHGHNEIDEPSFTQPLMYKAIGKQSSTCQLYGQHLIQQGIFSAQQVEAWTEDYENKLRQEFQQVQGQKGQEIIPQWLEGAWSAISSPQDYCSQEEPLTGVNLETLRTIAQGLVKIPADFQVHSRLTRVISAKAQTISSEENLDWASGEALAFGSLLLEGYPVRLSGQDCGRGTFSHRHAVWIDQKTEKRYIPLNHLRSEQKVFEVVDSPLAEASVMGFEYGYSAADPHSLVIWEAQFGDFANGAQVIIDQFVSSAEYKWLRLSGLVLLLPHGYEGQGPEHSSARLERYLQLCAQGNMRIVNCSTPASYFHVIRRQMHCKTRKPLVIITPKTLLRHKFAVSTLQEMAEGTTFKPVLKDEQILPKQAKRVILCSGKIYYELLEAREKNQLTNIAIIRLEQYYPFPQSLLETILKSYADAEFVWCQEEPKNMGAWQFLDRRLEKVLKAINAKALQFIYAGRAAAAAPSTGFASRHIAEQEALIQEALGLTFHNELFVSQGERT